MVHKLIDDEEWWTGCANSTETDHVDVFKGSKRKMGLFFVSLLALIETYAMKDVSLTKDCRFIAGL